VCLLVFAPELSWAQTTDDLFNSTTMQRLDLELHSADWQKLKDNFQTNTFYPADMKWNGQTVSNVGIRSRGRGSRNAHKPGLKIDFDPYSTNQKFLGLKSLVLDNLTQDPSGIHETVAMAFLTRLGLPAPREAHVRLYVRGEYIGLYALVEAVDKEFLARIYGAIGTDTQNDGWLYEFVAGRLAVHRFRHRPRADQAPLRRDDPRVRDGREEVPQGTGADHARQPDP
jgi:spore coat protein CotH